MTKNRKHPFNAAVGMTLLTAASLVLLGTSCSLGDDAKKDDAGDMEDRFAFLRQEESHPSTTRHTPVNESEETGADAHKPRVPVSRDKLKALEENAVRAKTDAAATAPAAKPGSKTAVKHFYDDFIALNGDEEIQVSLIFNSAPLLDVLSAFADILGFNFVADSDLKGVITLNINSTVTRRELWNTFDRMLYVAAAGSSLRGRWRW